MVLSVSDGFGCFLVKFEFESLIYYYYYYYYYYYNYDYDYDYYYWADIWTTLGSLWDDFGITLG